MTSPSDTIPLLVSLADYLKSARDFLSDPDRFDDFVRWEDALRALSAGEPVACPSIEVRQQDGAMTLVPEGSEIEMTDLYGVARATVGLNTDTCAGSGNHVGASLAIALTAASLRARASASSSKGR